MLNVVDAMAQGDVLKWKQVLLLDYNTAFTKMRKNLEESEYQKRLRQVIRNK